jgi:glucose/arabinose dehydrogenase
VQLNPATGAVLRQVAANLAVPQYVAADPLSGDLFFHDGISSGPVAPDIWELSNPAYSHPVARSYVSGLGALVNGLAFAPDGILYAADGNGIVHAVTGTRGPAKPKVTPVVTLSNPTGIAVGATRTHGQALSLWVATCGGDVEFVNLAGDPPTTAQIVTSATTATGHIMGLNVGPDGCVYISTSVSVLRLARTHEGCAATK